MRCRREKSVSPTDKPSRNGYDIDGMCIKEDDRPSQPLLHLNSVTKNNIEPNAMVSTHCHSGHREEFNITQTKSTLNHEHGSEGISIRRIRKPS